MRHSAGGGTARFAEPEPIDTACDPEPPGVPVSPASSLAGEAETAEYIADLLSQLERLANAHGFVRLQYILIQGRDEASELANAAGKSFVAKEP